MVFSAVQWTLGWQQQIVTAGCRSGAGQRKGWMFAEDRLRLKGAGGHTGGVDRAGYLSSVFSPAYNKVDLDMQDSN